MPGLKLLNRWYSSFCLISSMSQPLESSGLRIGDEPERPSTAVSESELTEVHVPEMEKEAPMNNDAENEKKETMPMDGEGESAIPEDPKLEAAENAEEDWAHALENPRNWPSRKKWVRRFYI